VAKDAPHSARFERLLRRRLIGAKAHARRARFHAIGLRMFMTRIRLFWDVCHRLAIDAFEKRTT